MNTNSKDQWALFQEDANGKRVRLGNQTYSDEAQAMREADRVLQESNAPASGKVVARRLLNG